MWGLLHSSNRTRRRAWRDCIREWSAGDSHKALGLAEWQVEDEAKCQGGLDGQVGVLQLPSTLADTP